MKRTAHVKKPRSKKKPHKNLKKQPRKLLPKLRKTLRLPRRLPRLPCKRQRLLNLLTTPRPRMLWTRPMHWSKRLLNLISRTSRSPPRKSQERLKSKRLPGKHTLLPTQLLSSQRKNTKKPRLKKRHCHSTARPRKRKLKLPKLNTESIT